MAPKRAAEAIDLTDDSPFYSSQPHAHTSSSQGYANSSQSSRPVKQARTGNNRTASGASQQDPVYIDDDEEEDGSATQSFSDQEYSYALYGVMHSKIVGCRFY